MGGAQRRITSVVAAALVGSLGVVIWQARTTDDEDGLRPPPGTGNSTTTLELDFSDPRCEVRVFLDRGISDADRTALTDTIAALPDVDSYQYIDEEASLAEFEEMFADDAEMLERGRNDPHLIPTSYLVVPATSDVMQIDGMAELLSTHAGVMRIRMTFLGVPLVIDPSRADEEVEVVVFLQPEIAEADREAVAAELEANPQVGSYRYVDEEESQAEFERLFASNEAILERMREDPDRLPTSFRVVPATEDPAAVHALEDQLADLPGVTRAHSSLAMLESIQRALDTVGGC